MKKLYLFTFLAAIIVGFYLTSCNTKREYSNTLHEKVVVVALIYSPSQHNTEITETVVDDYNNPFKGSDINGNKGLKIGKINGRDAQLTTTTIPEKYGVVFQCQHGTFTIEGSEQKYQILYQKLYNSVHDTVDVLYREMYNVTYDKKDKTKVIKKELIDLDFLDAQIISK
jgi:hypothetical protein